MANILRVNFNTFLNIKIMITEDYVSFEVAKLLKEKGFDEECVGYYVDDNPNEIFHSYCGETNSTWESRCCSCPTHQMAMKWLREVHDIHIVPRKDFFNGTYTGMVYDGRRENVFDKDDYIALVGYEIYEEAVEAAIKYTLENLI